MSKFSGKYDYSVDAKGRINFKKILKRLSDDDRLNSNYHLMKQKLSSITDGSKSFPFFYIFTSSAWGSFYSTKEIDKMPTPKRTAFLKGFCGEASLDSAERLTFPKIFLEFISSGKELVLQGDGDKIQVWSKKDYEEYISESTIEDESMWDMFG